MAVSQWSGNELCGASSGLWLLLILVVSTPRIRVPCTNSDSATKHYTCRQEDLQAAEQWPRQAAQGRSVGTITHRLHAGDSHALTFVPSFASLQRISSISAHSSPFNAAVRSVGESKSRQGSRVGNARQEFLHVRPETLLSAQTPASSPQTPGMSALPPVASTSKTPGTDAEGGSPYVRGLPRRMLVALFAVALTSRPQCCWCLLFPSEQGRSAVLAQWQPCAW